MKRFLFLTSLIVLSLSAFAQNDLGKADDAARIAISPYVDPSLGFNREVQ